MPTSVLQNCKLWVDGFDMSGWMNRMGLDYGTDVLDYTKWGDDSRVSVGGLKNFSFAHEGLWQTPGPDGDVAQDTCTDANATAFGDTKPNTPPFPHTPDLGFGGWIVDAGTGAYKIQSNKAAQQTGHLGGAGGKYCANDVANDNFTYFADIDPAVNGFPGLGFRYNENPEDGTSGNFWQQKGSGFEVAVRRSDGKVVLSKYGGAGLLGFPQIAIGVSVPLRLVVVVSGSNLDVYSEPIGGGARTAIATGVDLGQSIGGNTDLFNDSDHMRFGLASGSNGDIGTTFDNITVRASTSDRVLFDNVGTTPAFALSPLAGAVADVAYLAKAGWAKYEQGPMVIGDLYRFSVKGNGAGPLVRGVVLENSTVTSSGTGTAIQQGAVGATQKMYAVLHVLSANGSIAVTVESDDNESFTSASTRFTFDTVAAGQTAEWATPVDGSIDDTWWRAEYTVTGSSPSIEFVLVMGIK